MLPGWESRLAENLDRLQAAIRNACQAAARPVDAVRLVAVTKYVPVEVIRTLVGLGQLDIGENRVQQLTARADELAAENAATCGWDDAPTDITPRWHMIGHLQRNKVNALLGCSRIIHAVDSQRLAAEIDKRAPTHQPADVFIEVNVSHEPSKEGVAPDALPELAAQVATMPRLRLRGLMTMAPIVQRPDDARPYFTTLRRLLEDCRQQAIGSDEFRELSMGMSGDYVAAIAEGATVIRVGSALYEGVLPPR